MLHPALRIVTRALAWSIEARTGVAGAAVLAPLATLGAPPTDTLVVSLLGLEPEPETLSPSFNPRRSGEGFLRTEPPVAFSAVLLVAASHANYADALAALDHAVSGLRQRPALDVTEAPALQQVAVETEALSLADLDHLWATVGAPHRPSVVVRVRITGSEPRLPDPTVPPIATVVEGP